MVVEAGFERTILSLCFDDRYLGTKLDESFLMRSGLLWRRKGLEKLEMEDEEKIKFGCHSGGLQ